MPDSNCYYPSEIDELWNWAGEVFSADHELLGSRPGCLYHYTNAAGLRGILESQKLWATEAAYVNDAGEVNYGVNLARKVIEDHIARLDAKQEFEHSILQDVHAGLQRLPGVPCYIACFCEQGDLLSQWKGYGNVGEGFAVGFTAAQLTRLSRKHPHCWTAVRKVVYDKKLQHSCMIQLINGILSKAIELSETFPEYIESTTKSATLSLQVQLEAMIFTFKDSAFAEEAEWRAISGPEPIRVLDEPKLPVRFRSQGTKIIPYVEIDLGPSAQKKEWSLPIEEIVVGAGADLQLAERSVRILMESKGLPIPRLRRSGITLRGARSTP